MSIRARKLLFSLFAAAAIATVGALTPALSGPSAPVVNLADEDPPNCPSGTNWDSLRKLCV